MHRWFATSCSLLLLAFSTGCSTLGFSTNPIAHMMTKQTKQVLDASPRHATIVPRELDQQVLPTHYLEPGDELLIEANDIESELRIPADQRVSADGSVDLGEYGRVKVASLTLEQSEDLIESAIAAVEQEPASINVRLLQSVDRFYVIGEVNSPGSYPLIGHETVLDGIVAAGGLTLRASACDLLLARPTDPCSCRVTLPVCYRAITQLGDTTTNYQLKPGDRIFVGRQTIWEELSQCCLSPKSCERCCSVQRACGNPLVAQQVQPSFAPPSAMPTFSADEREPNIAPSENIAPIEEVHVDDRAQQFDNQQQHAEPELIQPAPPVPQLDGELDFGELLKQP
jgi:protein involved in polysaccharide export with SLBB domain